MLDVSPVRAVMQAIMKCFAEHRVLVIDAPRGLQHGVQQTVSSSTVPQGIKTAVQACAQLQRPVDDRRFLFQLCTQTDR